MSRRTSDDAQSASLQKPVEQLLGELRPKLHRYCARMTGSVVDGEDVVQETMLKAIEAARAAAPIPNPEGWLFCIAHHAALDFLRRRAREEARHSNEDLDMIAAAREPPRGSRDRGGEPQDLHAAAGVSTQQRHPERCARLFLAGDLRVRRRQRPGGQGGPAARTGPPSRARRRGRRRARSGAGRAGANAAQDLCRALQCA